MARAKRHRHKYYLGALGQSRVWTCALPDCNHYMPPHMVEMVNGKNSICWGCGADITLNPANMKETHPRCDVCLGLASEDEVVESIPMSPLMKAFIEGKPQ